MSDILHFYPATIYETEKPYRIKEEQFGICGIYRVLIQLDGLIDPRDGMELCTGANITLLEMNRSRKLACFAILGSDLEELSRHTVGLRDGVFDFTSNPDHNMHFGFALDEANTSRISGNATEGFMLDYDDVDMSLLNAVEVKQLVTV